MNRIATTIVHTQIHEAVSTTTTVHTQTNEAVSKYNCAHKYMKLLANKIVKTQI